MLAYLVNIGIKESMSRQLARQVKLTNMLMVILLGFGVAVLVPTIYENGINSSVYLDLFSIGLIIFLLWLNKKGKVNTSRLIISVYPPIIIFTATVLIKLLKPENVVVFDYFDARILLIALFIIPFLLFTYKEKVHLITAMSIPFMLVILFDPLHNLFGVGYKHFFGPMPKSYIVSVIYVDIALFFLAGSVYYFKANIESLLQKNFSLSDDLGEKNIELSALFEELEKSNEWLRSNETVIEDQKLLLKESNLKLAEEVESKTIELQQSNKELVKHNNELQQFSNTLSHNLRGPVANLLGLSQLFNLDKDNENRDSVADHIYKSAEALDGVIRDLNKIVELRNNLFQIKEKIEIKVELDDIWLILDSSIKQCNGKLVMNINAPVTYGVRSYFHSILYNLISNAIKYRHSDRDLIVEISTSKVDGECVVEIKDNGIGIDLEKHGDKMFGMYKRFHTHLEGKGLGLFLTKQQIEAMGGSIEVSSELNVGTTFKVSFPPVSLSKIESQLFYESKVADIYLDAVNKITTLDWKKMPTPIEFAEVFSENIEVFSVYDSVKWIVDLKLFVNFPDDAKRWVLDEAIDQYVKMGIKHIALIRSLVEQDHDFWEKFAEITSRKSLKVDFVESIAEAKEILLNI